MKLGFGGILGGCMDSWSCAQTLPLYKNASALVVSESKKGNQFMSEVLFKLVNKSKAIVLYVQFACQCGLIDVTLQSPLGSLLQLPLNVWLNYER